MGKNLHICLNMVHDPHWLGGVLYIQNLIRAIAQLPSHETAHIKLSLALFKSNSHLAEPIKHLVNRVYAGTFADYAYLKACKLLAEYVPLVPLQLLNPRSYDFVYPDLLGARSAYKWGAWVCDLQHCHLPHLFSQKQLEQRNNELQRMADKAPIIVLSSEAARNDFCERYSQASDRTVVMHFASFIDPRWFEKDPYLTQSQYHLPDHFFLVSNQFWKHKDHGVIIESLAILKERKIYPTIVCTGTLSDYRNPEYFHQLLSKIDSLNLKQQFIILGVIPRDDQIQLMRQCTAVIQPSLFEGWSSVIEDARSLGKAVIASDFPVHLEQNPPNSYFFEQSNAEALANVIETSLTTLTSGANPQLESLARQDNQERINTYGRRFLEIVHRVI
ncbi:glycosyltransferase family 4 protein [Pseudanabaena yagii]|uniref:Glycosyltransferase family 4 protein n=1 Tax=Pseudanabaena yagii GIHE-NHR1 TaxID=2722753 RepID=A0ABX1LQN4_9CYAN|nr:glycosyltransferase family 1 protein [Pseudanabaena yagii]NMF58433.1 glycosyltransferase family 4 protein [Pseudanabaena yagii GIHE-NHR1]